VFSPFGDPCQWCYIKNLKKKTLIRYIGCWVKNIIQLVLQYDHVYYQNQDISIIESGLFYLSYWNLPTHGAPYYVLNIVEKPLVNKGALNLFCSVQTYDAKSTEHWTNLLKRTQQNQT
jgi:hypothetical protein